MVRIGIKLKMVLRRQSHKVGIIITNIYISDVCTYTASQGGVNASQGGCLMQARGLFNASQGGI